MKRRDLLILLIAVALLIVNAVPVMAETYDPFDPDQLKEEQLENDRRIDLNASVDVDNYSVDLQKNDDGDDTYTLTISCKGINTVVAPNTDCHDWFVTVKDNITRVNIVNDPNENVEAEEIGTRGFYGCSRLKSVTMPSTVKEIWYAAFYNCYCLNEIDLSKVRTVGASAFNNCGPDPMKFNFRSSIDKALACSPAVYDLVRPDSSDDSKAQYKEAYEEMLRIMQDLDLDSKSDLEKVKIIYSWITMNVSYDNEALEYRYKTDETSMRRYGYAGTIHSALFARQAICHGYAVLLRTMLNAAGVDCVHISGPTTSGDDHAWNMIRLGDKWYLCDPTWDAGNTGDEFSLITAKYFLRSKKFFYSEESQHAAPATTDVYDTLYPLSETEDYYARIKQNGFTYLVNEGNAMLLDYTGKARTLTLPSTMQHNDAEVPVTAIGPGAFEDEDTLEKVIVPEGYTEIHSGAFKNCMGLSSITLPSTLKKIENDAFSDLMFLFDVRYTGTSEQFLTIDIGYGNYVLCSNVIKCSDGNYTDPRDMANAKISLSPKSFVYDGGSHLPEVTITLNGTVLEENKDYKLRSLYEDTLKPGKRIDLYKIEILGLGDYSRFGTTAEYTIVPAATKLNKLKSGKKTLTCYWTKKTEQVSGYQVQYALNKKFTKGKKTINVKGNKARSLKIKKLKSKKIYYVRVRTRKYSYGKYTDTYLYSTWSNAKKIKVK